MHSVKDAKSSTQVGGDAMMKVVLITFVMLAGNTTILHTSDPMDAKICIETLKHRSIPELSSKNTVLYGNTKLVAYTCAPSHYIEN